MVEVCIFVCPLMLKIILRQFIELLYSEHLWYGRNHERQIKLCRKRRTSNICIRITWKTWVSDAWRSTRQSGRSLFQILPWRIEAWTGPCHLEESKGIRRWRRKPDRSSVRRRIADVILFNKQSVASTGRRAVWRFPIWSGALIEEFQTSDAPMKPEAGVLF